jgi:hypothetical protein
MVVQNKILSDPNAVVRWRHEPGSSTSGNGTVCYNYKSACFNDPTRINDPSHKCNFESECTTSQPSTSLNSGLPLSATFWSSVC